MQQSEGLNKKTTVIISVLAVLLLASVGLSVYLLLDKYRESDNKNITNQNNLEGYKNDKKNTPQSNNNKIAEKTLKYKEFCGQYEKMCFTYPENWSVSTEPATVNGTDVKTDKVFVVSPDKKIKLKFFAGIYGIGGGPCDSNQKIIIKNSKLSKLHLSNPKLLNKTYAISGVIPNYKDGKYANFLMLSNKDEQGNGLTPGEYNGCQLHLAQLLQVNTIAKYEFIPYLYFMTNSFYHDDEDNVELFSTREEAEASLSSDNYKKAFDILASVRYKE